jgi:hypothetical protein
MGWVASYEHIQLPFSTPQTHTLPSADTKAAEAANNKERLFLRHYVVWCHTIFLMTKSKDFLKFYRHFDDRIREGTPILP